MQKFHHAVNSSLPISLAKSRAAAPAAWRAASRTRSLVLAGVFAALTVLVDLGYLGIRTDYPGADILLPHKKPRQSQRNPQPALTPAQKADNRAISQVRVAVEQAIAGLKRYNILVHRFRNRRANFHDDVIALCAGIWNFALIY